MKPCKLNIQSEILCKIIYALANFDSDHVHVLQRNKLCIFRKGIFCIWYLVPVFYSESVYHSILWKPLSIDYSRLNHQEISPQRSTLKLLVCGNLYVSYCIVCHSSKPLFIQNINWPYKYSTIWRILSSTTSVCV